MWLGDFGPEFWGVWGLGGYGSGAGGLGLIFLGARGLEVGGWGVDG